MTRSPSGLLASEAALRRRADDRAVRDPAELVPSASAG